MSSKNLKNQDKKKTGFEKIPDRIEDMSPLPSPNKKGFTDDPNRKKNIYGNQ